MFENLITTFESFPNFFYFTVAIFSLMVGSFLNVVVYRFPKMLENTWYQECREFLGDEVKDIPAKEIKPLTLSKPNSTCPKCNHAIKFYENIPIISWLFLKGKCSNCKSPISIRYPLVEATTAVLSVVVAMHWGVTLNTLFVLLLTWGLVSLTLIDLDHMLLPDQVTLPLMWLGLLVNIQGLFVPLTDAVLGAAFGYLSLYIVFLIFKLATGKDGMGFGDFKLVAVFGAWFGWQLLPLLILMSSVVGALVGITLMVLKKYNKDKGIPFGPYIAIAGWVTLLWGDGIWSWYLSTLS